MMKKPIYKKWWFIGIVILLSLSAIGNALGLDETQAGKTELSKVESNVDIPETEVPSDKPKEEEKEKVVEPVNTEPKKEDSVVNGVETKAAKEKEETAKKIEQKKDAEEKAAREITEKAEADKKAKSEADAKAKKASDKLAAEKKYYLNNVKTDVDTQMGMYDKAWNEIWKPTFEGIGSTVNVYEAYENMKSLERHYDKLYSSFGLIDGGELSKDNKKLLKEFTSGMRSAAMWRGAAAEKARKMFDKGDYSPSAFEDMKTDIAYADNEMMAAIIALTSLEESLGVDR